MSSALDSFLRELILEVAQDLEAIGAIEESLKWGQPSFAPKKRGVGSSVRIQHNSDGTASLMFICHTGLVAHFRTLYCDTLKFDGNRGIIITQDDTKYKQVIAHCVALALTYHRHKHEWA